MRILSFISESEVRNGWLEAFRSLYDYGILTLCLNWKEHMAMWLANIGSLLVNIY